MEIKENVIDYAVLTGSSSNPIQAEIELNTRVYAMLQKGWHLYGDHSSSMSMAKNEYSDKVTHVLSQAMILLSE